MPKEMWRQMSALPATRSPKNGGRNQSEQSQTNGGE